MLLMALVSDKKYLGASIESKKKQNTNTRSFPVQMKDREIGLDPRLPLLSREA